MTPKIDFSISACWGPRRETPASLARRWLVTGTRLQSIDPALRRWYKGVDGHGVELKFDLDSIEADLAESAVDGGYIFEAKSDQSGRASRMLELTLMGGFRSANAVGLGTDHFSKPDPSIQTYRIFQPALLALAEGFDAERAFAYPTSLSALWQRPPNPNPAFPIAWISYVAPRVAHLVTPPSTAIVGHRPDGGIVMAATDETFDVDNPAHMSVAGDIERAVAPLHLRPWEPEKSASRIIS